MYNYKMAVRRDLVDAMQEEREQIDGMDVEELRDYLNDRFFDSDCVTGNASGSYTFNRYQAKVNVLGDDYSFEYLADAEEEGFITAEELGQWILDGNWEPIDVIIRCYLLPQVIDDVIAKERF